MKTFTVELDRSGIREVLNSQEVRAMLVEAAEWVASDVRGKVGNSPVVVNTYTTDRIGAAVTIASEYGLAYQARLGVLTKAAGKLGVDVTGQ